jgi:hypothetical protein
MEIMSVAAATIAAAKTGERAEIQPRSRPAVTAGRATGEPASDGSSVGKPNEKRRVVRRA